MGFVATTLSICDPVGGCQRLIMKGRQSLSSSKGRYIALPAAKLVRIRIFGRPIRDHFPMPYMFAIRFSAEDILKKKYAINWNLVREFFPVEVENKNWVSYAVGDEPNQKFELDKIKSVELAKISNLLEGLKQQTVRTKWITAEIDRITALIYFMITISVFTVAIAILPGLLHKFSQVFQDTEFVRLGVLIFSVLALSAVGYMLILRIRRLLDEASTVFKYLTALGAIKVHKERFKGNLQDVEGYLNNNNWTLAKYWIERIEEECTQVFLSEVSK